MANPIDIIITKEALAAIDLAIKKVDSLDKELAQTAQNFIDNSKKMAAAMADLTPSSVNNRGNDSAKLSADLDKLKAKYVSVNEAIQKRVEQTRLAELRLQQQREKAFDKFEKNLAKEQNAYNRTQNQLNNLTKAYNDLAARKERYNNLSANEESRLSTLQRITEKYNSSLKNIDTQIGKNTRNVGNYASGWNGLGNSINQLTREAPAFAVSLNTGFLALSNNIPILIDELNKLTLANKELAASGQPTKSVFKQFLSSLFSVQTALSAGILLLTLYGGAIIDSLTGSKQRKEALEKEKKAQEEKTNAEREARNVLASLQSQEISKSKILLENAKNVTLTYKERESAVKELQERYPDYLGHLSKEQILAGDTAAAEELLNDALIKRGIALSSQQLIGQEITKGLENQKALSDRLNEIQEKRTKLAAELQKYDPFSTSPALQAKYTDLKNQLENLFYLEGTIKEQYAEKSEVIQKSIKYYTDQYNANAKYLGVVHESTKASKEAKKADLDYFNSSLKARGTLNEEINKSIDRLRTEAILNADDRQHVEEINKLISRLTTLKNEVNKIDPIDLHIVRNPEEVKKQIREISQEMKNFTTSFRTEFFSSSGFGSLETFFNKEFDNLLEDAEGFAEEFAVVFNSIAEVGQEAFNFISQASQKNFESEKNRLQSQYDIAIKYAGDSKEAQEKLADDLEKRKAEIATREAKAKQKQAIVNIAIDTAQAIVAAWVNPGYPGAIALTAVLAGLGIAQAAVVASQEIPQYWMGGTHDGGLMMVNDGKGPNYKETIVTPDGKIMKPQGKNVIMDAPAGTEIFTHDQWNAKLAEMLQGKGIDMAPTQSNYSGLSKNDMYDVLSDTLGMQPQYHSNFDAEGATSYILKRGNKTTDLSRRGNSGKLRFK